MSDALLGRPLWYELLTSDMKAAEAFYSAVMGWTTTPFEGATSEYTILSRADGTGVGGVMPIPEGMNAPPHWVMYVGVPKLEDAVAHAERLGARALAPVIEVPDVGRIRPMLDPQGAMFSLYEPSTPPEGPETQPGNGDVAWRELYTTDAEAAMTFYGDLFGWRATDPAHDMGPMGKYHLFGRSFSLGGMMNKPPGMQAPSHWGLYFRVADVDGGAERVKANGGRILNGPMDVPGGSRVVQCMDAQGAGFSLHQLGS